MIKGARLKYQWPSTPNVVSILSTDQIKETLNKNPIVSVSEKLDGSNICISSNGWIASRRVILVNNFFEDDLSTIKLVGSSLSSLKQFEENIRAIHGELQRCIKIQDFQTLLYGEWLQHRTAVSFEDRYQYKERGFKSGHLYVFGLSIILDNEPTEAESMQLEKTLSEELGDSIIDKPEPRIFTFGLGSKLLEFLKKHGMDAAPFIAECSFEAALLNEAFTEKLINRTIEGFIMTGQGFILKWKPVESQDRTFQIAAVSALRTNNDSFSITNAIDALEKVCMSAAEKSDRPKKKPEKRLYAQLFKSAETKFQRIEDLLDESMTAEKLKEVQIECGLKLKDEMKTDFIGLGYRLEEVYSLEMDVMVDGILRRRTENWLNRLKKKKN